MFLAERLFLFLRLLRCFTSPGALLTPMNSERVFYRSGRRVSPFGNPRITGSLPPSRGLSQARTSFVAVWCQGIHHLPLILATIETAHAAPMDHIVYVVDSLLIIFSFQCSNFSSTRTRALNPFYRLTRRLTELKTAWRFPSSFEYKIKPLAVRNGLKQYG